MKYSKILWAVLLAMSVLAGYLLSKASLIGRLGINFFYQQYKFLKVWWQGALFILAVWLAVYGLLYVAFRYLDKKAARFTYVLAFAVGFIGFYFTYRDFRDSLSHRLLGERFHLGGYLFWIGWLLMTLFFVFQKRKIKVAQPSKDALLPIENTPH